MAEKALGQKMKSTRVDGDLVEIGLFYLLFGSTVIVTLIIEYMHFVPLSTIKSQEKRRKLVRPTAVKRVATS